MASVPPTSPPYTKTDLVKELLDRDYDTFRQPNLQPHIQIAHNLVVRMQVCAASKTDRATNSAFSFNADTLELIERCLAAHSYQMSDPAYTSKSTAGASGSFAGQLGKGLEASRFGIMALRLDYSGCLEVIDKRKTAGMIYLGKAPCDVIPVWQRETTSENET